jgi:UDP-3-O-[3-hydroxymyristoyl] glucosamine N-acyltransferase
VPISLHELAERTGATVAGDGTIAVSRVATLESAGPGSITFLVSRRFRSQLAATHAAAVIIDPEMAEQTALPKLLSATPYLVYAKVAAILHPAQPMIPGVHPTAVVDPRARVAASASVGPNAVVGAGAVVGERARIGAGSVVGEDAAIGDDVVLHAHVTIYDRCIVGPRSIMHSGAVIGADGFGMAEENGRWVKIPQIGRVVVGADVEIGANSTVDRGAIDDTVIENDVKLDNQIQVGHNCRIGAHTAIAGCVGIAGSTRIGRNCKIGGAAMIAGHIEICDGTVVGAASQLLRSIEAPDLYSSACPAMPHSHWRRVMAITRRLPELDARVRQLEREAGRRRQGDAEESDKGEQ